MRRDRPARDAEYFLARETLLYGTKPGRTAKTVEAAAQNHVPRILRKLRDALPPFARFYRFPSETHTIKRKTAEKTNGNRGDFGFGARELEPVYTIPVCGQQQWWTRLCIVSAKYWELPGPSS